jgi:glycosyltransferase involved in cell wall biosynthesis
VNTPFRTSVIIPVYNEHDYLERCLRALEAQTIPLDEIIVVDNNSSDDSIEKAKMQYPNAHFLFEKRQGIVYARDTGFAYATGDILVKIDADTLVFPDWHEQIQAAFSDGKIMGWSGAIKNTEIQKFMQGIGSWVFNFFTFDVNRLISGGPMLLGCNMAIRKTAWEKISPRLSRRNDIWEDLDIACEMHTQKLPIYVSRKSSVTISARSANTNIARFSKRLYGQSRVYLIRGKYISYTTSLLLIPGEVIAWMLLAPLSAAGKKLTHRPRPEQY